MNPDPMETIKAEAEGAVAPAGEEEAGAPSFAERLKPLVLPSNRHPREFVGKPFSVAVNGALDGQDRASTQAQLGESIALCADAVHPGAADYGLPPLAHLGWSTYRFFKIRRDHRNGKEVNHAPKRT